MDHPPRTDIANSATGIRISGPPNSTLTVNIAKPEAGGPRSSPPLAFAPEAAGGTSELDPADYSHQTNKRQAARFVVNECPIFWQLSADVKGFIPNI
jgi:hypothetical protein